MTAHLAALFVWSAVGWASFCHAQEIDPAGSRSEAGIDQPIPPEIAALTSSAGDTLANEIVIPDLVVGSRRSRTADAARVNVDQVVIGPRDAQAVADLGFLLPATMVNVNSRGESLFMIRGSSERQVTAYLDGIPLNVPWDERVDLSMVPALAIERLEASRGISTLLTGPNSLAGSVNLVAPSLLLAGQRTQLGLRAGSGALLEGRLLHQRRRGAWRFLATLAHRQRDGFLVPADLDAPYNQTGQRRTNSDLRQTSLLLRAARDVGASGSWRLLMVGLDSDKGVPPETHLKTAARFWRYPLLRRVLLGTNLLLHPDADQRWDLEAGLAVDFYRQQIRKFDDVTYSGPPLEPSTPFEDDTDRTGTAQIRLGRRLGAASRIDLKSVLRYTRHRETLEIDGPESAYAQVLSSTVVEASLCSGDSWNVRAGAGFEVAATPETGDKPAREPTTAGVGLVRLAYSPSRHANFHAAASRRSRFPSLRELYSGALGRFVLNPELAPERQDLIEIGGTFRDASWDIGVAGFASFLHGGIERKVVPEGDGQFQRVNTDVIRNLGLECVVSLRPWTSLSLTGHLSVLVARQKEAGSFSGELEDRPDYLAAWTLTWTDGSGVQFLIEVIAVGERFSADLTDPADGLQPLPAQASLNLRLAKLFYSAGNGRDRAEIFLRLNNVTDASTDTQVGLPGPGRMLTVGIGAWLGG